MKIWRASSAPCRLVEMRSKHGLIQWLPEIMMLEMEWREDNGNGRRFRLCELRVIRVALLFNTATKRGRQYLSFMKWHRWKELWTSCAISQSTSILFIGVHWSIGGVHEA